METQSCLREQSVPLSLCRAASNHMTRGHPGTSHPLSWLSCSLTFHPYSQDTFLSPSIFMSSPLIRGQLSTYLLTLQQPQEEKKPKCVPYIQSSVSLRPPLIHRRWSKVNRHARQEISEIPGTAIRLTTYNGRWMLNFITLKFRLKRWHWYISLLSRALPLKNHHLYWPLSIFWDCIQPEKPPCNIRNRSDL